ncbi:YfiT family bacillithiol transferase [Salmonirosea aquatica]|uniref:Putative metal-dependent hydrolase n=1 Tax=Salmonirosea aquatica TaxID=2654236 RepID=A0A7C9BGJ9_9BACT|nr:putative metal-dependent hydrolase [Cytophagaceae bacterium SJW1-29]
MDTETLYRLKYPIGEFEKPAEITTAILDEWINTISDFPRQLSKELEILTDSQLETPYRLGGWTVRQVVHHCADSHMNAFCRFKLALTEDSPRIKPYFEALWAELADAKQIPVEHSLFILLGLHARWVVLLQSLSTQDLSRIYIHPEHGREFRLDEAIGNYAWHSNHHLAHIKNVVKVNQK